MNRTRTYFGSLSTSDLFKCFPRSAYFSCQSASGSAFSNLFLCVRHSLGNAAAAHGLVATLELPTDKEEKHGVDGAQTPSLQGSLHSKLEPYVLSGIKLGAQVFKAGVP